MECEACFLSDEFVLSYVTWSWYYSAFILCGCVFCCFLWSYAHFVRWFYRRKISKWMGEQQNEKKNAEINNHNNA